MFRAELVELQVHRSVLIMEALYFILKGASALMEDSLQTLVDCLGIVALQELLVALMQVTGYCVILVIGVCQLSKTDLARRNWVDPLVVDLDNDDKPLEHSQELRPCVRSTDRLQLRFVHFYWVFQSAHDLWNLLLDWPIYLKFWINLCDQEFEDVEELL
jgi:hypothetical protein